MSTNFPGTSLDSYTRAQSTDQLSSPSHSGQHDNAFDAIEALEAKVGVDSSAVTTSHDYKLSGVTGTAKAVSTAQAATRAYYIPSQSMFGATTSGAAVGQLESTTNKVNSKTLDFDTSADEYAHFGIVSPAYWNAGTVTATFYWTASSGSGTVCWGVQGVALSNDDALDTAYGTAQTTTDTLITALDVHVSSATGACTIAGTPVAGDWIQFRIYRDVSEDTLAVDARLLGVKITFSIDSYDDT